MPSKTVEDRSYVLRGGTVVDGTGGPRRRADVAVAGGRILAVGPDLDHGGEEIDASERIVAPGFIDIHTHYDAQVFWDPDLTPSSVHGVTSVIAGNCGFSIAPARAGTVGLLAGTLEHVEDMNYDTLAEGVPWEAFETFTEYLAAIEGRGVLLNFGCYVGHTAVRLDVMGDDAYGRAARPDELVRMQEVVRAAMDGGALGFASSRANTHNGDRGRPVPSRLADLDELRCLLVPLSQTGKGVVALVPGTDIPLEELFALQQDVGRPLTWTALVSRKGSSAHLEVIEAHREALSRGINVRPQVSCRPIVFQMNLLDPFTFNTRPSFARLMDVPREERMRAYGDPAWRHQAWTELNAGRGVDWTATTVADSDLHGELLGQALSTLSVERGCSPLDVMLDLSLEEGLATRFGSELANNDAEATGWLLQRPEILLGLADSGAHVSQLCDACFATDFLGRWVRDEEVVTLERAVEMLSGEPAAFFGLRDRGTLEAGKSADLVVFDPKTVGPGPTRRLRDFPAGGERLTADAPTGISHVLVNGVPIRVDGAPVGFSGAERPGQVLRS